MKSKKNSSVKKKANLKKSERILARKDKIKEDFITRRMNFGSARSRRNKRFEVIVPETKIKRGKNIKECSVKRFDMDETECGKNDKSCASRSAEKVVRRRLFANNREGVDSSEKIANERTSDKLSSSTFEDHGIDNVPVYFLKTALIPLKDIGDLLKPYSKEKHNSRWMFIIKRIKRPTLYRQSSNASDDTCSGSSVSLESDSNDSEVCLSELSTSDSEDSSSSWSIGSLLPRRMKEVSSSEEDSESQSDELEEIDDDFILHTSKNRKRTYLLRKRNSAIRKKIAKYCKEQSDEESSDNSCQ